MAYISDNHPTIRLHQIEQFPQIRQAHDDVHSNCSICISDFTKGEILLILPCLHKFHRICIQPWLSNHSTCPTCRERVLENIDGSSNEDDNSDDEDIQVMLDVTDNSLNDYMINSFLNSSHDSSSDMSVNFHISSEDSESSRESTTLEIDAEIVCDSDSSIQSIAMSDESLSEDESDSTNDTQSNSSSSDIMFPSSEPSSDDDSSHMWEMSDDNSNNDDSD